MRLLFKDSASTIRYFCFPTIIPWIFMFRNRPFFIRILGKIKIRDFRFQITVQTGHWFGAGTTAGVSKFCFWVLKVWFWKKSVESNATINEFALPRFVIGWKTSRHFSRPMRRKTETIRHLHSKWTCFATFCDWLKNLTLFPQPIRNK